jgi:hypothetical protein
MSTPGLQASGKSEVIALVIVRSVIYSANMRTCGACGTAKPLAEFHRRGAGHQSRCIPCRRAYDAAYYLRTRERQLAHKKRHWLEFVVWYRQLKSDRPCSDWGGIFHHAAMT